MRIRSLAAGAAVAVIVSAAAVFGTTSAAFADTCPNSRDVYINGGESHYTLTCYSGKIYVDGRVTDTKADGYCMRVKALINGYWHYSERACPKGTTRYFSWNDWGNEAFVYTYKEP
jgi:hypothetical protein